MLPIRGVVGTSLPSKETTTSPEKTYSPIELLMFGQKDYGMIVGGYLNGKPYPQPSGESWQQGMTSRCQFDIPDRGEEIEQLITDEGYKKDFLLSGGGFQTYGFNLDGWVYRDKYGINWHIKLTNMPITGLFLDDNKIDVKYKITKFGLITTTPNLEDIYTEADTTDKEKLGKFKSKEDTLHIGNIGCSSFFLPIHPKDCTWAYPDIELVNKFGSVYTGYIYLRENCVVHLVSVKGDGSKAILCVGKPHNTDELDFRFHPVSYVSINCTDGEEEGDYPVLSSSVLRTVQQTVGQIYQCNSTTQVSGQRTMEVACPTEAYPENKQPVIYSWRDGGGGDAGVVDVLIALYYDEDDELEELRFSTYSSGNTSVHPPTHEANVITEYFARSKGTLTHEVYTSKYRYWVKLTETSTRSGNIVITANPYPGCGYLDSGSHLDSSCEYTLEDSEGYYRSFHTYSYAYSPVLVAQYPNHYQFGTPGEVLGSGNNSYGYRLGERTFTDHRVIVPLTMDEGWGWSNFQFKNIRYAYNVMGFALIANLYAEDFDVCVDVFGALTPSGPITRDKMDALKSDNVWRGQNETGEVLYNIPHNYKYGAYNARTGEGVAGKVIPVGYT